MTLRLLWVSGQSQLSAQRDRVLVPALHTCLLAICDQRRLLLAFSGTIT